MLTWRILLFGLALTALARAQEGRQKMVTDFWDVDKGVMTYRSKDFSARAELPRGWVSWKIREAEFLHAGKKHGAILFRHGKDDTATFTQLSNLAHDALLGKNGQVMDGLFLTKLITGWTLPKFELYAGFNKREDHDLVIFLSDDVSVVRLADPFKGRSGCRTNITHANAGKPRASSGCVIVHKSGYAISTQNKVRVGKVPTPDGGQRLAVLIKCKGHAANSIHFTAEPVARAENFLVFPRLNVKASNQQKCGGPWAIYEKDTDVEIVTTFQWLKEDLFDGSVKIDVRHALGKQHLLEEIYVKPDQRDAKGKYTVSYKPKFTMPGVSDVFVQIISKDGQMLWMNRYRMLYDWKNYKPVYSVQPDFNTFWDDTLAELKQIPLEPEVKRVFPETKDWEFYEVSFNTWKKQRVWCLLKVPMGVKKPLPAIVGSHPGGKGWRINRGADGVYGSKIKADPRFVNLNPLIRGFKPDQKDIPFNQPWWGPLDSRDDYVARTWYCTMVRAVDYLLTRKDLVDPDRIVAAGGSQGGALAVATAALHPKVALCLADSPSNAMLHHSVDPTMYGSFGPTVGQVPDGQTLDDLKQTLSYYDPANLAVRIKCPTAIGLTVGDLTVHSMGGLGIYHNLTGLKPGQKWFLPGVNTGFHANSRDGGRKFRELKDKLVADGQ